MDKPVFKPTPRTLLRRKRADLIVEEIKRWIVAGELRPGDRLPQETQLEELLQSSRGTVREALKVLESQGLIEITRGAKGGARVSNVSYEKTSSALRNFLYFQPLTWSDIYRVREKLEPMMAASVIDMLTPADIAALRQTVELCKLGITGEVDPRTHRIAELEFHSILSQACANPLLRLLCRFINEMLRDLSISDPRNIIVPKDSNFAVDAVRFHSALIDAFEAKDAERVRTLMNQHVHDAGCIVSQREEEVDQDNLLIALPVETLRPRRTIDRRGPAAPKPKSRKTKANK
ncbi:MAG: FadR family transcriptional regulator [Afipia sp.]|jgi:DNA-binding FadR family transcriptional regulator|nr:FadR family transcriptional regulator [Afipia sp.]